MLTPKEVEARFQQRVTEIEDEIAAVCAEVRRVHDDLVLQHYPIPTEGAPYGFGHTCHAYAMLCFARIDGISMFWAGGKYKRNATNTKAKDQSCQTERMTSFMDAYSPQPADNHLLAVELWRHTLMHEGIPRELTDDAGDHYQYTLQWRWDDPHIHYMRMTEPATPNGNPFTLHVFRVAVLGLFADLEHMVRGYCAALRARK